MVIFGVFLLIKSLLDLRDGFLKKGRASPYLDLRRLREASRQIDLPKSFGIVEDKLRQAGLKISLGEIIFAGVLILLAFIVCFISLALFSGKPGYLIVILILPIIMVWCGFIYLQSRVDRRK